MSNHKFKYYESHNDKQYNISPGISWDCTNDITFKKPIRSTDNVYKLCDYCPDSLLVPWYNSLEEKHVLYKYILSVCPKCGWWKSREVKKDKYISGFDPSGVTNNYNMNLTEKFAILKEFDISDDNAPLNEVANVLKNDWKYAKDISAQMAEDLVCEVFKSHLACDVHYFNGNVYAKDDGVDFVLVNSDKKSIAFQVKRRLTDKNERINQVKEFIASILLHNHDEGIYVTTAEHFTSDTISSLEKGKENLSNKNISINLVNASQFRDILNFNCPSDNSSKAIQESLPKYGWSNENSKDENLEVDELLEITRKQKVNN